MALASQSAEQETHVTEGVTGVQGRSPSQIAWGRLKRDKVGMISLGVVLLYVVVALLAPVITRIAGVDTQYHTGNIGDGGIPKGGFLNSDIGLDHLLGVEPVTGRDIFAELLYGSRISLLVAFLGTLFTCVIGVFMGIVSGFAYDGGLAYYSVGTEIHLVQMSPLALVNYVAERIGKEYPNVAIDTLSRTLHTSLSTMASGRAW